MGIDWNNDITGSEPTEQEWREAIEFATEPTDEELEHLSEAQDMNDTFQKEEK